MDLLYPGRTALGRRPWHAMAFSTFGEISSLASLTGPVAGGRCIPISIPNPNPIPSFNTSYIAHK
jgi:hypothetical protein